MDLKDAPRPRVLIDMDCPELPSKPVGKRCDFVFVSDHGSLVIPLELKNGALKASEVQSQLQAGARFAERIIPDSKSIRFVPIAVVGGKIHTNEINKLRQTSSQVSFGDKRVSIETLRCGQPLTQALKRSGVSLE